MAFPAHPIFKGKITMNNKERSFTIELKSKETLKNVALNGDLTDGVLIEGSIGELKNACFVSDDILEIVGSMGILRINVTIQEIREVKQP
jgi:hypothetical protein